MFNILSENKTKIQICGEVVEIRKTIKKSNNQTTIMYFCKYQNQIEMGSNIDILIEILYKKINKK